MIASWIPNALDVFLFAITFFIALRAGYLYMRIRSPRLFILSMGMGMISLSAAGDFASLNVTLIELHTDWFLYLGQAVSFLFIFLSLLSPSNDTQRVLMRWQIVVSGAALLLLLFSFAIPDVPNTTLRALMSGTRPILCFLIFCSYTSAFMRKETRFSLLMGIAFLLLSAGYVVLLQKYFVPLPDLVDNLGDLTRMVGLTVLFLGVLFG